MQGHPRILERVKQRRCADVADQRADAVANLKTAIHTLRQLTAMPGFEVISPLIGSYEALLADVRRIDPEAATSALLTKSVAARLAILEQTFMDLTPLLLGNEPIENAA